MLLDVTHLILKENYKILLTFARGEKGLGLDF